MQKLTKEFMESIPIDGFLDELNDKQKEEVTNNFHEAHNILRSEFQELANLTNDYGRRGMAIISCILKMQKDIQDVRDYFKDCEQRYCNKK